MENPSAINDPACTATTRRYWQTAGYYAAFIVLGLTTASFGPSLPYIAEQTHTQLAQVSSLLALRSLGYLLGSFRGGRLYDQRPGHPVILTVLISLALALALIPAIPFILPMGIVLLVVGLAEGALDVGGNTLLMWAHGSHVGPFMNGLHFFFGVGAFLSPILVVQAILLTGSYGAAYWAIAVLMLPVAFAFTRISSPVRKVQTADEVQKPANPRLVFLMVAFFFLYVGAESSFGTWAYTYATRLNLANQTIAAYITSAFWGALTVGRLLAVPISIRLSPRPILWIDLSGCAISLALMVLFPGSSLIFWIGATLLGLSMASIFPMALSLAEKRLQISGKITGWFFVGASLGGMVVAWAIGQVIEPVGPPVVMWIISGDIFLAILLFAWIR